MLLLVKLLSILGSFWLPHNTMKVIGPLFSLAAKGTIGDVLTYGRNQFGNWVRRWVRQKYSRTQPQTIQRRLFEIMHDKWFHMTAEEQFLWEMASRNYKEYFSHLKKYVARWGRCLFAHHTLLTKKFTWNGSPFPPSLEQMFAEDEIEDYGQMMSDLATIVGMQWCTRPKPFFFLYLGHPDILGIRESYGIAIAIKEPAYKEFDTWHRKQLVAHELTHCIIAQHRGIQLEHPIEEETICDEVGNRVADRNLTPVYTYKGKTLSEMVRDPTCNWHNYLASQGYFD